jgi:hypothetical protein
MGDLGVGAAAARKRKGKNACHPHDERNLGTAKK